MSQDRASWLGLLARADRDYLEATWKACQPGDPVQILAGPETGLLQLITQAGSSPVGFQFGEATCTRCVVLLGPTKGYAVQLGSDLRKATLAAYLDAYLQTASAQQRDAVLAPILLRVNEAQQAREQLATATSVRFYTAHKP